MLPTFVCCAWSPVVKTNPSDAITSEFLISRISLFLLAWFRRRAVRIYPQGAAAGNRAELHQHLATADGVRIILTGAPVKLFCSKMSSPIRNVPVLISLEVSLF